MSQTTYNLASGSGLVFYTDGAEKMYFERADGFLQPWKTYELADSIMDHLKEIGESLALPEVKGESGITAEPGGIVFNAERGAIQVVYYPGGDDYPAYIAPGWKVLLFSYDDMRAYAAALYAAAGLLATRLRELETINGPH